MEGDQGMAVRFARIDPEARIPNQARPGDAGLDLYTLGTYKIEPGAFVDLLCGVRAAFDPGWWGHIVGRSSTFRNRGLLVIPAVIDSGYTGPLFVGVVNQNKTPVLVEHGDRLGQLILMANQTDFAEIREVSLDQIPNTVRGQTGFGSTGR